ncbi:MAG: metallophosphoesterase [Pseudomonadota bacterium]
MFKFIVLADLHIVPQGKFSHGIDSLARLNDAVAFVNENHSDAAFVVCAGDLADHGEPAAYMRFREAIEQLVPPVHLTLGNHDNRPAFLEIFGTDMVAETGCLDHVIDTGGYRIIVLDTSEPELSGAGRLAPVQIDWLKSRLAEAEDMPVVIVLHHNIVPFHVQTDFIILQENEAFADAVLSHRDVRQVISGHVHMTTSGTYRGVPFCTFAGAHYSIEPTLESRSGQVPNNSVRRREGPGQLALVLCDRHSVVVHMENFLDRHPVLSKDLFRWS